MLESRQANQPRSSECPRRGLRSPRRPHIKRKAPLLQKGEKRPAHWAKPGPKPAPAKERKRRRRAATRRASLAYYRKHRDEMNERARRRNAMPRKEDPLAKGLHVTNRLALNAPRLTWLDQHGVLRIEEELSAEELIRRYEATRKIRAKEGHPCP